MGVFYPKQTNLRIYILGKGSLPDLVITLAVKWNLGLNWDLIGIYYDGLSWHLSGMNL